MESRAGRKLGLRRFIKVGDTSTLNLGRCRSIDTYSFFPLIENLLFSNLVISASYVIRHSWYFFVVKSVWYMTAI
jgi:hypothetical protein